MTKVSLSRVYRSSLGYSCKFAVKLESFPNCTRLPRPWAGSVLRLSCRQGPWSYSPRVTPASIPFRKTPLAERRPGGKRSLAPSAGEASHSKDLRLTCDAHV